MGFFNNWPYSNLHNLNLDWIIAKMKEISDFCEKIWNRVKPVSGDDPINSVQAYERATEALEKATTAGNTASAAETLTDAHVDDKNNPHSVTPSQIGAEPKISVLDISRGGTGASTPAGARANIGAKADFTILPVAQGGTGASTPAGACANIGAKADFTILPVAQGGTGASTPAGACAAIGAFPASGGTVSGKIVADGGFTTENEINVNSATNSGKIRAFTDNEGGNFQIVSPNGTVYEFDAYNNTALRLRVAPTGASATTFSFSTDGNLYINGKKVSVES